MPTKSPDVMVEKEREETFPIIVEKVIGEVVMGPGYGRTTLEEAFDQIARHVETGAFTYGEDSTYRFADPSRGEKVSVVVNVDHVDRR